MQETRSRCGTATDRAGVVVDGLRRDWVSTPPTTCGTVIVHHETANRS